MILTEQQWNIGHLRQHLQAAVDLEFWTIPFYMSAMYSIQDRKSDAFQKIQSVLNQEMLHVQLAANIANAYGLSPVFQAPVYQGQTVPHLNYALDNPDPRPKYSPFSAEIGPFDLERVNTMCLIEYPEWYTGHTPDLHDDVTEYGSIGEFYAAVAYGAGLLKDQLRGGVRQVDLFSAFYRNAPTLTITDSGEAGFRQAAMLVDMICDQGEGTQTGGIRREFQNTADDSWADETHYTKFTQIRDSKPWPLTYPLKHDHAAEQRLQGILIEQFTQFRGALGALFAGENPQDFSRLMMTVGAAIQNCWKSGVTPRFS